MSKKQRRTKKQQGDVRGFNRLSQALHGVVSSTLSNFRLSLTFRIAIHYGVQLMRTTLPMCLLVTLFYMGAQVPGMERTIHRIAAADIPADGVYTQDVIQDASVSAELQPEEEYTRSVSVVTEDGSYEMTYASALPQSTDEWLREIFRTAVHPRLFRRPFILTLPCGAVEGRMLHVSFQLEERLTVWGTLMAAVLACDLIRVCGFIRRRNRLDKRVLAPIRDITDMAATLSASNLSNRINIAGTKNELKDLATVINTMLDRIERSYNSQKQFVSDASHELRTPIAVIQGYVNMLQRWGKDDKTVLEEGISAIAQETASMKELVESLLFLARHDKKTLMMEMESFDPCDVMTEVHKEAAMMTPEDHFLLTPLEHTTIEADRGMVKQVLRILCDNAMKYTPKGGTITMGVQSYPGGCTLILSDTGPGISREELPKVFDRFYRSDSARKAESGGHGLGLSIARIIVVAHGGKIRVRSKVGEGTTFAVVLPQKQSRLTRPTAEEKSA